MPDRLHPSDLLGNRIYWLLDLTWAGQVIRLSDAEIDVLMEDGTSLHYHGALDVIDVDEGLDFLSDASGTSTSASIDAILPVDVPRLIAQGHDLGGATGQLSRWIEGTVWEARRVVITGQVSDPEYGRADEPVSFTLGAAPWEDSSLVPAAGEIVTGENLDDDMILSLAAEDMGLAYPVVIGHPGQISTRWASSGICTGSQVVRIDNEQNVLGSGNRTGNCVVLAGHHVTARKVYLTTDEYTAADTVFGVTNTYDRQGHPIACVTWYVERAEDIDQFTYNGTATDYTFYDSVSSPTVESLGSPSSRLPDPSFQPATGTTMSTYVVWKDVDDSTLGGAASRDGSTMRDAGSILEWLLAKSSIPVDHGRFSAARHLLAGFKLDFTIDEQTKPWDYITANLLPILPVSIVSGGSGVYPVVWRYDATEADAVAHLDTGVDPYLERASNVSYDRDNIVNDFSISYAMSIRTGNYQALARVSADDSDGATTNYHCWLSQSRYRLPNGDPYIATKSIESTCIYDDVTAQMVLAWVAKAYALARRRVDYIAPEATYGWMERGMVVTITDADIALDRQVALVEAIGTDGSPMVRIKLLIIEDTVLDSRMVT